MAEDEDALNPEKEMKATLMLADYAVVANGKLTVVGAGWKEISPLPTPFAVAGIIEVPWDQTNRQHVLQLALVDADGNPLVLEDGEPFELPPGPFEVGRPPGVRPGISQSHFVTLNTAPLPFEPGQQYVWELSINERHHEDWRLPFTVSMEDQSGPVA